VQLTSLLQPNDPALGAAQHGARDVEGRGGRRATGDDEGIGQRYPALEVVDLHFQPAGDVRRHDHEMLLQLVVLGAIGGQLGADGEELTLHTEDGGVPAAVLDQRPRHPKRGDGFIDGAVGLGARIGL